MSSAEHIKKDVIDLYTKLYMLSRNEEACGFFSKELLKKLKYTPQEVQAAIEQKSSPCPKARPKIKQEILEIKTKEQVRSYFQEHLADACKPEMGEEERNGSLKKVTLEEIKYLYQIVFGISLPEKCRKIDVIYKIKNYYDNEERTADLTKNF